MKISMVHISLVGFVHVAHLNQGEIRAHKKGAANLRHPSETIFQPSDIFLSFFFWGGAEVQKSETHNGEVLRTLSSVLMIFFQNKESSSYSNIPKGSMFGTIRIFETLE